MTLDPTHTDRFRTLPLVAGLDAGGQTQLSSLAELEPAEPGDVLFREGDPSDCVYVVGSGHVSLTMAVERRGESTILSLGQGDLLGWSGLERGRTRVATARATERSELYRLPSEPLLALCERDHEVGYAIMKQAFRELAARLHETRLQLLDMFRTPGA
jgi:CRP-like cAMP-binding protein